MLGQRARPERKTKGKVRDFQVTEKKPESKSIKCEATEKLRRERGKCCINACFNLA
jgi:hypothetical protein